MPTPYAALEANGGMPVELYRFVANGVVYTLTSADIPVTFDAGSGAEVYAPAIVQRGNNQQTSESTKLEQKVAVSVTQPLAQYFVNGGSAVPVTCTIRRFQRANLTGTLDNTIVTTTVGTVTASAWQGAEASVSVTPAQRTVQQAVPRFQFQGDCNHALYDTGCTLIKSAFTLAATVAVIDVSGRILHLTLGGAAQKPPYYTGGILNFGLFASYIEVHNDTIGTGVEVTLLMPTPGLIVGSSVTILPGCDLSYNTCINKFANGVNHAGFPYFVEDDPWANGVALGGEGNA